LSPTPPVGPVEARPVQHRARIAHRQGQRDALGHGHALEEHRHGEGRHLPLGHRAIGQTADHEADFLGREGFALAFPADDFLGQHGQYALPGSGAASPSSVASIASRTPLAPKRKVWGVAHLGRCPASAHDIVGQRQVLCRVRDCPDTASRLETDGLAGFRDHPQHDARRLGGGVYLGLAGRSFDEVSAFGDGQVRGVFDQAGVA
jgi:hypothetical protein